MQRFKDVLVAKGSNLADALVRGDRKVAVKFYAETSERYRRLYPEDDRKWFQKFMPV